MQGCHGLRRHEAFMNAGDVVRYMVLKQNLIPIFEETKRGGEIKALLSLKDSYLLPIKSVI
jgi:hypothetical protein